LNQFDKVIAPRHAVRIGPRDHRAPRYRPDNHRHSNGDLPLASQVRQRLQDMPQMRDRRRSTFERGNFHPRARKFG
jgi:hypothetical protein